MYWNNPIETVRYPSDSNIIFKSQHNDRHCLFYDPEVDKHNIANNQTLQDLCDWANTLIKNHGVTQFLNDKNNHYEISNFVKLNLWVHDLPLRGSVKPMLLTYTGNPKYNFEHISGTGASRLRAMERIPSMITASAFITTHIDFYNKFKHLEKITTFNRFAELCNAESGQEFLFRLTDSDALYGIDWYEYNSRHTASITPSEENCVLAMSEYLTACPTIFSPEWFDQKIIWSLD